MASKSRLAALWSSSSAVSAARPTDAMLTHAVRTICVTTGLDACAMEAAGGGLARHGERLTRDLKMADSRLSNGGARGLPAAASGGSVTARGCALATGTAAAGPGAAGSTVWSPLASRVAPLWLLPCGTLAWFRATARSSSPRATSGVVQKPSHSYHTLHISRTDAATSAGAVVVVCRGSQSRWEWFHCWPTFRLMYSMGPDARARDV